MSSSHANFVSGTIFGIVLGMLLGHLTLWSRTEPEAAIVPGRLSELHIGPYGIETDLGHRSASLPYFTEGDFSTESLSEEDVTSRWPGSSPLANALALDTVEVDHDETANTQAGVELPGPVAEPNPLDIAGAAPIEAAQGPRDQQIREAIDRELEGLPRQQREIWFEALRDMHVDDVTGVIRMWKTIGGPLPGFEADFPLSDLLPEGKPESLLEAPSVVAVDSQTGKAIRQAIRIVEQNLFRESSLGSRRMVPQFVEELQDGEWTVTGVVSEIDFSLGQTHSTGNPLDVQIHGPGMFLVQDQHGESYLTRLGRFSLNADRKLCLAIAGNNGIEEFLLQPETEIPQEAVSIEIRTDGAVQVRNAPKQREVTEVGQLKLVPIFAPHLLRASRQSLFEIDEQFPLQLLPPGSPGCGSVQAGMVERSNINVQFEREHLNFLNELLKQAASKAAH